MEEIINDPYFGLILTIFMFYISVMILKYVKIPFLNPLILTLIILITLLLITKIPYESYYKGGELLNLLITPATVALALPLYKTLDLLKKNFYVILISITVTSAIVCFSIVIMSNIFNLDNDILASIISKSITTAIAVEITNKLGGIISVTIISIIITGNLGMLVAPTVFKIFNINDELAQGIALGTSSHAMGTVKAMELGEIQGAMSGVAMSITGIIVVFIAPIFYKLYTIIQ